MRFSRKRASIDSRHSTQYCSNRNFGGRIKDEIASEILSALKGQKSGRVVQRMIGGRG